jgi:hypothetical protein
MLGLSNVIVGWLLTFGRTRSVRQKSKGWSINVDAVNKNKKEDLIQEYDILDVFGESNQLDDGDRLRMSQTRSELDSILKNEEIKTWQRSRDRFLIEGDRNTTYFHVIANQRRRKKKIFVLEGPCGHVETTQEVIEIATSFYKNLFSWEDRLNISMGPHFWDPDDILTAKENASLEKPFLEEEIKQAIFESYASGAPCADGLSFLFYQKYWDLIKNVFLALVRDFESGDLNVSRHNYAIISLIPKEPDVKEMKKFRPISLGNCSLKIISKAITNRIAPIGDRIIASNQTAFIKRHFILERLLLKSSFMLLTLVVEGPWCLN